MEISKLRVTLFLLTVFVVKPVFSSSVIFLNKTGRDIWVESKGDFVFFVPVVKKNLLKNNQMIQHSYLDRARRIKVRNAKDELNEAGQKVESRIKNQVEGTCIDRMCRETEGPYPCAKNNYHMVDPRMAKELVWDGTKVKRGKGNFRKLTFSCGKAKVRNGILYTGFTSGLSGLDLRFIITSASNGKDFYLTGVGSGKFFLKRFFKEGFVQPGKFMKAAQKASLKELLPFVKPKPKRARKGVG